MYCLENIRSNYSLHISLKPVNKPSKGVSFKGPPIRSSIAFQGARYVSGGPSVGWPGLPRYCDTARNYLDDPEDQRVAIDSLRVARKVHVFVCDDPIILVREFRSCGLASMLSRHRSSVCKHPM